MADGFYGMLLKVLGNWLRFPWNGGYPLFVNGRVPESSSD
jgi:hypothetical protein